ncbi:hypothetical protein [Microbulbifer sp. 2205BS26-8]|uniref:hypothetical protein n=1 Tax=Microbulbifer sp. 2205BS26-8 TaxID=3064386 RepID=UPI00273DB6AF|nr:hypothetical protein [Microbulbifer sp. 2205BS26-8]MDP5209999.1 hypothetical protein [Microbulbifer sp. 2205BS26-8]
MSKSKQSRAKLIKALSALGVSESEYKNLGTAGELEALLKQKRADKALQDAVTSPGDIDSGEQESDTREPGIDSGETEAASGEQEIHNGDPDPDPDPDEDLDFDLGSDLDLDPDNQSTETQLDSEFLNLRALCGFEVKVIDIAVIDRRQLGSGEMLKVATGENFQAGCETCRHLISYRVVEQIGHLP